MFPVLVVMYVKLARSEEREALAEFGDAYRKYMNGAGLHPEALSPAGAVRERYGGGP